MSDWDGAFFVAFLLLVAAEIWLVGTALVLLGVPFFVVGGIVLVVGTLPIAFRRHG